MPWKRLPCPQLHLSSQLYLLKQNKDIFTLCYISILHFDQTYSPHTPHSIIFVFLPLSVVTQPTHCGLISGLHVEVQVTISIYSHHEKRSFPIQRSLTSLFHITFWIASRHLHIKKLNIFKLTYHIVWRQMHLLLNDSLSTGNFFASLQITVCQIRITCGTQITLLLTQEW